MLSAHDKAHTRFHTRSHSGATQYIHSPNSKTRRADIVLVSTVSEAAHIFGGLGLEYVGYRCCFVAMPAEKHLKEQGGIHNTSKKVFLNTWIMVKKWG